MLACGRRLLLASALSSIALTALISATSFAQETPPDGGRRPGRVREGAQEGGRGGRAGGPRAGGNVEGAMKMISRSLEQLGKQITDASKRDENLGLIGAAERAAVSAKLMKLPPNILDKAADEPAKVKLQDEFRADLITAVRMMLDIEESIAAGKGDAAQAKLAELVKHRDASHKKLGVED